MTSRWRCPVCGEIGKQTKEHVWPQWLRDSPIVQDMLASAHGERFPYEYSDLAHADGRLVAVPRRVSVAKWVPQITAPVCEACNTGWMSRLEVRMQATLAPVVLKGDPATIRGAGVRDMARWAVKTAMTYQGALKMQQGCFTPFEVRRMAKNQEIPPRCKVWVRSTCGPLQWIATHYEGLFVLDAQHVADLGLRDNLALTLIGIPSLVLVVGVAPGPEDLWLLDSLVPSSFGTATAPQIWPDSGRLDLPTPAVDAEVFDPRTVFELLEALGGQPETPLTELTPEALSDVLQVDHRPEALLEAAIDQFIAECDQEILSEASTSDALLFGTGHRFNTEQLSRLFSASLTLVNKHATDQPTETARRLYNLAHLFFASEAHPATLILAITCACVPDGEYGHSPEIWQLAGNAAWHFAAFGVAAAMYTEQVAREPGRQLGQFNRAEAAFMCGDFEEAIESLNGLEVIDDESTLSDTLVCLRVTVALIVVQMGLRSLDGFGGPTMEKVIEMVLNGEEPNYDSVTSFKSVLLALLVEKEASVDPGDLSIAKAYLTDSVDDWAGAATTLLAANAAHPALKAILRKGASCGPTFIRAFEEQIESESCPTLLPDGASAIRYVREHAYPRLHRNVRELDSNNKVLRVM